MYANGQSFVANAMMVSMKLYNTLSHNKEELKPIHDDWVGLYTCGPTVYNFAHIGNLRTYIFEDILQRTLEHNGYIVRRVMNITDVGHLTGDSDAGEEKMEKAVKTEGKSIEEITQFYTDAFFKDLEKLNIKKPDIVAPATQYIGEQIALIQMLFERGFAYQTKNAIYFDVAKFPEYGKLSGQSLKEKIAGARDEVVVDQEKKNPADFALWFFLEGKFKNHLLHWPTPWGEGFPGWHIECSAISRHFLGQPFDIHTGGVDHIGVHHTNEIAQSEAAYGVPLANIWMHGEFLLINEGKMAKSEGNFITLAELEKRGYSPLVFRYLILGTHYRKKINFTWESLDAAKKGLEGLYDHYLALRDGDRKEEQRKDHGTLSAWQEKFDAALSDDLNTPQALAVMFDLVKNEDLSVKEKRVLFDGFDQTLGLNISGKAEEIPPHITAKLEKYNEYRTNKQFMQSDALRKELEALGYEVRDTDHGSRLVKKFF